ncbi:MAG: pyruvate kinase [Sandaracinaceae bacterium]|nr:pyruvate kinase [Sandaracinaceae bacterium]
MLRRVKIVCTIGPAVMSREMMERLVDAGMDCARLNFSHGTHESHREAALLVREASGRARRPIALLADLCGPKMRVGRFAQGRVELRPGARFVLTTRDVLGDEHIVSQTYEALPRDVGPGTIILLDDGLIRLRVVETTATDVITEVEVGGELSDRKGMNIPGAPLSTPALTPKDREDLRFAVEELKVDYVALSFVRRPEDVEEAMAIARGTPIIAKIEKPEAIQNLEQILDRVDGGVMVARGDLGVEVGPEWVPLLQKKIIREANRRGKLVITATQMLDSMVRNPRPTRAEAADVANALLDGSDAIMLSNETASGKYPIEAVRMMDAIARAVEEEMLKFEPRSADFLQEKSWGFTSAAAIAAARLSYLLPLKAIVTFTRDGRTARILSENRPRAPVIAITARPEVASRLALEWGVFPRVEIPPDDLEETLRIATSLLVREGFCQRGDEFALVIGWPLSAGSNTVKLHRL